MAGRLSNRGLGLILVIALLVAGGRSLWLWLDQPIQTIAVQGDFHYSSPQSLQQQLIPMVEGQGWLSVDLNDVRERARRMPWIHEVRVSRHWPNTLTFELEEQRPVAWWNDAFLLNAQGDAFIPGTIAVNERMPNLAGPGDRAADVMAYYKVLQQRLGQRGMVITQLTLEPRGAWRFQVNDSFWVILGRIQLDARLDRFVAAWNKLLAGKSEQIRYLDLRYPNGLAIGWHGQTAETNITQPRR